MQMKVEDGYKGMKLQRRVYDTVEEIRALLRQNDDFHDGTVEGFQLTEKGDVYIAVEHGPEKTHYYFAFKGITQFTFDIDIRLHWIGEVTIEESAGGIHALFNQVGIDITASSMTVSE